MGVRARVSSRRVLSTSRGLQEEEERIWWGGCILYNDKVLHHMGVFMGPLGTWGDIPRLFWACREEGMALQLGVFITIV